MSGSESRRQYQRANREAHIRGGLLRFVWIFRLVAVVVGVGVLVQTWTLATGRLPAAEASVLRYQTRNLFIAEGVIIALLVLLEWASTRFERSTAKRALVDPLPDAAWAPVLAANRIRALLYLWLLRLSWPLFFALVAADACGLLSPPMNSADRWIFVAIGGVFFVLWAFVARRRGPFTLNRHGRLEGKASSAPPKSA
ncbi:MAG: hypothetical protein EOO73_04835 [Myxococcales bacterium]|nr:MAG: hypothetical protein EOO73_04835 [Myxococcales bacterium]